MPAAFAASGSRFFVPQFGHSKIKAFAPSCTLGLSTALGLCCTLAPLVGRLPIKVSILVLNHLSRSSDVLLVKRTTYKIRKGASATVMTTLGSFLTASQSMRTLDRASTPTPPRRPQFVQ